jgi:hypothetical protein
MASYSARKSVFIIPTKPARRDTGPRYDSLDISNVPIVPSGKPVRGRQYTGKLFEREQRALAELAYKKSCVAPLHKSNLVYITPGMSPGSFRKNEVL